MRLLNLDGIGYSLAPTPVVKYHLDGLPLPYEGSIPYGSYDGFPSSYMDPMAMMVFLYLYDGLPLSYGSYDGLPLSI